MIQLSVSLWLVSISWVLVLIGLYSVVFTFLANPGIPEELFNGRTTQLSQSNKPNRFCAGCNVHQHRDNDNHCHTCGVCIRGLDHHCIFFGKCIGDGNINTFNLILVLPVVCTLYTFILYGYTIVMV